jgi:cell wall-active antibiotic response 4TMS protein YvqF
MSDRIRCSCRRCTIRSLMGPAIIITIGVLFLLSEVRGGTFDFSNTYPVILIVIGAVSLAAALAPMEGHVSSSAPPVPGAPGLPPSQAPGSSPGAPQGQRL